MPRTCLPRWRSSVEFLELANDANSINAMRLKLERGVVEKRGPKLV
jgi:hypothetical protein